MIFCHVSLTRTGSEKLKSDREPFQTGFIGATNNFIPASAGVRSIFRVLQGMQAVTMFDQSVRPPFDRGVT